ncbi:unnamed protein product, partial [Didymodactylos carnosus]
QIRYPSGSGSHSVATGDFNGDNKTDLVVGNGAGSVSILIGNGNGTFQPRKTYLTGSDAFGVATSDFNGDQIIDLAVVNVRDNTFLK